MCFRERTKKHEHDAITAHINLRNVQSHPLHSLLQRLVYIVSSLGTRTRVLVSNRTWVGRLHVQLLVPLGRDLEDVPLHAHLVLLQVDAEVDDVAARPLLHVLQVHLAGR